MASLAFINQGQRIVTRIVIGIQARSTSHRFPDKCSAIIGEKPMMDHVIDNCISSAEFMNRSKFNDIQATVCLLIPKDDKLSRYKNRCVVVEGSEEDVLSRYKQAADLLVSDYIVRVTGDCPLLAPYIITKHAKVAILNNLDYVSNVNEDSRTEVDGRDVEVMSRDMLEYLNDNAKSASDREHVTTLARRCPPQWARIGHVVGFLDLSDLKYSVDTPEDLERVRKQYNEITRKVSIPVSCNEKIFRL